MAFHMLPCPADTFGPMLCELEYHFLVPGRLEASVGDIVRLDEIRDAEEEAPESGARLYTGASLHRIVAQVDNLRYRQGSAYTRLSLVPLDHPVMYQVELILGGTTSVYWVGSHEPLQAGYRIRIVGSPVLWVVRQVCTSVRVQDLPPNARIAFLSEVYA